MTNSEKLAALQDLSNLRSWQKIHLNAIGSFVAYDLMLQLAIAFAKNEPIAVKQIFISSHSYTAVRMYYKIFLQEDLIYLSNHPDDKRVKIIKPTIKFDAFINGYLGNIQFINQREKFLPPPPPQLPTHEFFNANRDS